MDANELIAAYTRSLNEAVEAHAKLVADSQKELDATIEKAKGSLAELVEKAEKEGEVPQPESAWVKDHLVLNKEAVDLFQNLFKAIGELVPELKKLASR